MVNQVLSGNTATALSGTTNNQHLNIIYSKKLKNQENSGFSFSANCQTIDYEELELEVKEGLGDQLLELEVEETDEKNNPLSQERHALVKWDEIEHQIDIERDISVLVKYHAVLGNKEFRKQLDGSIRSINKCEKYKIKVEMAFGDYYQKLENNSGRPEKSVNPVDELTPKQQAEQEIGKSRETIRKYGELSNLKDRDNKLEEYEAACNEQGLEMSSTGLLNYAKTKKVNLKEKCTGNDEWYTPKKIIEKAIAVMGSIDCDPASCDFANLTVSASTYYTYATNGLDKNWYGNVFMNPPYSRGLMPLFASKLIEEIISGNTKQAIVVTNNDTDTGWFHLYMAHAKVACLTKGRLDFYNEDGEGEPLCGQTIFYFGDKEEQFIQQFSDTGIIINKIESSQNTGSLDG